ncbi:hypothetical protein PI125_g16414 [Phytophthora idaei]|nr:hypothetical protein PI125_g16414 [Phytophthora idaei]
MISACEIAAHRKYQVGPCVLSCIGAGTAHSTSPPRRADLGLDSLYLVLYALRTSRAHQCFFSRSQLLQHRALSRLRSLGLLRSSLNRWMIG